MSSWSSPPMSSSAFEIPCEIKLTISKRLTDRTSVGASLHMLSESFGRVRATGMSVDIGVQYKSFMDCENLDVGFAIRNFGQPVTYGGEGLGVQAEASDSDRPVEYYKVDAASFDLPLRAPNIPDLSSPSPSIVVNS